MLLLAGAGLAGCNPARDDRTVGQRTDQAVAQADRTAEEAARSVREAGRAASAAMGRAGAAVADKTRDATITAAIKAKLAADERLSALAINVDTNDGRVVLRGSAPDTAARNHATELARSAEGVVAVVNELNVQPSR
jgi:osmotically-inducible protein OsmY